MKYSTGFRNSVLRKVLPPSNRSVAAVAREMGVSNLTVYSWLRKVKDGTLEVEDEGRDPSPSARNPGEKFKLLLQSKTLSEDELGLFLRQHGLYSEHLGLWEQELEDLMADKVTDLEEEIRRLKKENQQLLKKQERDKTAMAEALALLTLKKKVDALLGQEEED